MYIGVLTPLHFRSHCGMHIFVLYILSVHNGKFEPELASRFKIFVDSVHGVNYFFDLCFKILVYSVWQDHSALYVGSAFFLKPIHFL